MTKLCVGEGGKSLAVLQSYYSYFIIILKDNSEVFLPAIYFYTTAFKKEYCSFCSTVYLKANSYFTELGRYMQNMTLSIRCANWPFCSLWVNLMIMFLKLLN